MGIISAFYFPELYLSCLSKTILFAVQLMVFDKCADVYACIDLMKYAHI